MVLQTMTLQQSISYVKSLYPEAKIIRLPAKWYRGRYVVVMRHPSHWLWDRLGSSGGYCRKEKAWKAAARHIKRGTNHGVGMVTFGGSVQRGGA